MKDRNDNNEFEQLIRTSMKISDKPSVELNNSLKASLYKKEAVMRSELNTRAISLWYVPMILNFLTFLLFAVLALLMIANPILSKFIAGVCGYFSIAGIVITGVGVKRTNMKEDITVRIKKRGVLA